MDIVSSTAAPAQARRRWLRGAAACLAAPGLRAQAPPPLAAVLATPGPGSAVSAVPELALAIGAARADGLALRLKFTGGGGVVIRELLSRNADFGVFGITAAMNENLQGRRFVALAAIEDRAPIALMVRSALKGVVRTPADLRGRVVGLHSSSSLASTNSAQLLRLLLRREGLPPDAVRLVAAGQSWETQAGALASGVADAVVSEEPFGLRLERQGVAFALLRLGLPEAPVGLPGEGYLRGALIATSERVDARPDLAAAMVRTVQRTLAWRLGRDADEVARALQLEGEEAAAFAAMLRRHPRQFSDDGRFSAAQIRETDEFLRRSLDVDALPPPARMEAMLVDRWAGRKA
jgi:ABC-type nitrate/sulfonate/bicarbonate transport system substrate-binding protein